MSSITTRAAKGSALTHAEVDANFNNLNSGKAELSGPTFTGPVMLAVGSAAAPSFSFDGDPNTGIYNPAADTLAFAEGGVEVMRIDSSGRVGIGTTSPNEKLEVVGGIRASGTLLTGSANSIAMDYSTDARIVSYGANTSTQGALTFLGANSNASVSLERLRIDSSGRLLVGTSSSIGYGGLLQVVGGDTARPQIHRNLNDQFPALIFLSKARGTASQSVSNADEIGQIVFVGYDGTGPVTAATIACFVDGTPGANDMPGRLVFSTTADGAASPTERMRIKSTGIVNIANTPTYADNAAATSGGLLAGDVYRKSDGTLMIRY